MGLELARSEDVRLSSSTPIVRDRRGAATTLRTPSGCVRRRGRSPRPRRSPGRTGRGDRGRHRRARGRRPPGAVHPWPRRPGRRSGGSGRRPSRRRARVGERRPDGSRASRSRSTGSAASRFPRAEASRRPRAVSGRCRSLAAPGGVGCGLGVAEDPEIADGRAHRGRPSLTGMRVPSWDGSWVHVPAPGCPSGRLIRLRLRPPDVPRAPGPGSARRRTRGRRPPGSPLAIRVTVRPRGLSRRARYMAVASPSRLGLVQRMTSVIPSASTRTSSSRTRSCSGPIPSMGFRAPWSTWYCPRTPRSSPPRRCPGGPPPRTPRWRPAGRRGRWRTAPPRPR